VTFTFSTLMAPALGLLSSALQDLHDNEGLVQRLDPFPFQPIT